MNFALLHSLYTSGLYILRVCVLLNPSSDRSHPLFKLGVSHDVVVAGNILQKSPWVSFNCNFRTLSMENCS